MNQRTISTLLLSCFLFALSRDIVLSAPLAPSDGGVAGVMTEADWQEMVKLQEYIWQKELDQKIASAEKAMLDAAAATNAGATPAQKALFDQLMEGLGDKWGANNPAGEFPVEQSARLTEAQQKALKDAYDDVVRNAAEEAEKELQRVAAEGTKKIGGLVGSETGANAGDATVVKVIESKGSTLAGDVTKITGGGISRKGLSVAAAKLAATAAGKTILKVIPILNTAAMTIEIGTAVSDTLGEAVLTNIHAVDKLEKFLAALLNQESSLLKELSQLNAPEVLQAEKEVATAEDLLPQLEKTLGKNNPQVKDLKKKINVAKKARDANEKRRKEIERQLKKIDELKKKTHEEITEAEKKTGLIDVIVPVAVDTVKGIPSTVKDFINWISSPFSSPSKNPPPPAEIHGPSTVVEIPPPIDHPDDVQLINMEIRALEGLRDRAKNAKDRKEAQDQIDDAKAVRKKVIEKQNQKYKEELAKGKLGNGNSGHLNNTPKPEDKKITTPPKTDKTIQTGDDKAKTTGGEAGAGGGLNVGAGAAGGSMFGDIICAMENVKRITNAGPTYVRDATAPKGIRAIPGKDSPTINAGERAVFKFYSLNPSITSVESNFTFSQNPAQYDVVTVGRKDPDPAQKNRLILSTTECKVGVHGLEHVSFDQTVTAMRGNQGILITKGTCTLNIDCGSIVADGGGGGKESDYTVRPESYHADDGTVAWATAFAIFPQQFVVDLDGYYSGVGFDAATWAKLMSAHPFAIKFSTESGQQGISTDITKGIITTNVPFKRGDAIYLSALYKGTNINDLKSALGIKEQSGANPRWMWGIGDTNSLQKKNNATHYVPFVGNDPNAVQPIIPTLQPLDSFTTQKEANNTFTITAVVKPSLFGRTLDGVRLMAHLPSGYKTLPATKMTFSNEAGPKRLTLTPGLAEGTTDVLKEEMMTFVASGVPANQAQGLTAGTYITFQAFSSTDSHVLPASKGIEWTE